MKKLFDKRNKFLLGILLMSLGTLVGFQNCSSDQFYQAADPNGPRPVSTDLSKVTYQPGTALSVLNEGEVKSGTIVLDLETGIIVFNYVQGTATGTKTYSKETVNQPTT